MYSERDSDDEHSEFSNNCITPLTMDSFDPQ